MTLLGGDDNHAVGGFRSIESCCRCVFQHIDAVDILRIDAGDGITDAVHIVRIIQFLRTHIDRILKHNAVNHPKRFAVTDKSGCSSYSQTRHCSHLAGIGREHEVGDASFKHGINACGIRAVYILSFYRCDGAGELSAVNSLITGHHHVIKSVFIISHHYMERLSGPSCRGFFHSYIRKYQFSRITRRKHDSELSIGVGGGAVLSVGGHDSDTHKRAALAVRHLTGGNRAT